MSDTPPTQPPGWYHAQGDPEGTQRYWDGTQWQGGPQPVPGPGGAVASSAGGNIATAGDRFLAFLIDVGIFIAIYIVALILIAIASSISDGFGTFVGFLAFLAYLGYWIYNFIYLQGTTGQTIGKRYRNTKLISLETGQPVGPLMAFLRQILIGIFAIPCYLDHWWILVDQDNQRLSDKVLKYHVHNA